jgi:CheY-like chemotaxis protein
VPKSIKVLVFGLFMNVLIIHRQQSFLQKVKEKFLLGGWQVHTTDNGLDGLLTARHHPFDLVLCGFDLPVVSGTEVVRTMRLLSLNRATPVFFISSGNESLGQLQLAEQLEANMMSEKEIEDSRRLAWLN